MKEVMMEQSTLRSAPKPRKVKGSMPARSVRVSDEIWQRARNRAAYEGVTVSHVIFSLLEGYAKGLLNLPQVHVTYQQPKE
jgi:hypothetical protein